MRLTLIRHGATEWNSLGRWQGHADTPLSEAGEEQARLLSRRLLSQTFDLVYSSDLARAARTAELALPGSDLLREPRLREVNFGAFDGGTYAENKLHPLFEGWVADPFHSPAPGGESFEDVRDRALGWLTELPAQASVLAFTHSALICTLVSALIDLPVRPREGWIFPFALRVPHTSITVLGRKEGNWALERLGDDAHLEAWASRD